MTAISPIVSARRAAEQAATDAAEALRIARDFEVKGKQLGASVVKLRSDVAMAMSRLDKLSITMEGVCDTAATECAAIRQQFDAIEARLPTPIS